MGRRNVAPRYRASNFMVLLGGPSGFAYQTLKTPIVNPDGGQHCIYEMASV